MDADGRDEIRNQLRNLEADRTRGVNTAMGMAIDGIDRYPRLRSMLAVNRGGDDRGRKTRQGSDLDDAARRKNADEAGQKKIIAGTDTSGIADIIPINHGVQEIHFSRRGDLAGISEFVSQLTVFDFELFEGFELAYIEGARGLTGACIGNKSPHVLHQLEAATRRRMPKQLEVIRQRRFHGRGQNFNEVVSR